MTRITNVVLAEKIDNLKEITEEKIQSVKDYIRDEIRPEVRANTKFRHKTYGVITMLSLMAGFLGSIIAWILSKVANK